VAEVLFNCQKGAGPDLALAAQYSRGLGSRSFAFEDGGKMLRLLTDAEVGVAVFWLAEASAAFGLHSSRMAPRLSFAARILRFCPARFSAGVFRESLSPSRKCRAGAGTALVSGSPLMPRRG
jgi:hypothetical protein